MSEQRISSQRLVGEALGESLMWSGTLPLLYQGLAFPDGPWEPPKRPHSRDGDRWGYWYPLLHLLLGPLGWDDPALGVRRWVERGMPVEDSATHVLRRWWGEDALMLSEWDSREDRFPTVIANQVAQGCGGRGGARSKPAEPTDPRGWPPHWKDVLTDRDQLHLSRHVPQHLMGPGTKAGGVALMRAKDEAGASTADLLILPSYRGWLRTLHALGGGAVDVVVRPLGWLGTYRGFGAGASLRMIASSPEMHMLGSQEWS